MTLLSAKRHAPHTWYGPTPTILQRTLLGREDRRLDGRHCFPQETHRRLPTYKATQCPHNSTVYFAAVAVNFL